MKIYYSSLNANSKINGNWKAFLWWQKEREIMWGKKIKREKEREREIDLGEKKYIKNCE